MSDVQIESQEAVDLNELLGLTDDDISVMAAESKAEAEQSIVVEQIDEPHITVSTKKVVDVLKISALIAAAGENSFEGKVVVFNIKNDHVEFLLSDNKRNIQKDVDILNEDNRFTAFLAFNSSFLARISKVCGTTFTIIQRETGEGENIKKSYVLKINGGELHMDNINMAESKYVRDYADSTLKEYSKSEVVGSIQRLYNYASTSIKTGKNIDFVGNVVQASPINSLAKITYNTQFPTFRLSLTDCKILTVLSLTEPDETISINSDGKIFTGKTYKFKTESYNISTVAYDTVVERMFGGEHAVVDAKHLSQISELSVGLDSSLGNLKFNYTEEGRVECELLTKRENSKLTIQGTSNTSLVKLENPVEIPANNLRGALSIFPAETTLNMRISTDGVSLESSNMRVAVLGKGVGK